MDGRNPDTGDRSPGKIAAKIGQILGYILSRKWWIGLGVLVALAVGLFPSFCSGGPDDDPEPGWLGNLREDLEQLPDGPANYLRVGQGDIFELGQVDRLLFHTVTLEPDSTLLLNARLPVQELRAGTIKLGPRASILGVGRPSLAGDAGRAGAAGGKCRRGQNGTNGDAGGAGGKGVDLRLETLALVVDETVTIDTSGGAGGAGGAGGGGGSGGRGDRSERCHGGNGGTGGSGGNGGSGGDAGNLHIRFGELRSRSEANLSINDLTRMVVHLAVPGQRGTKGEGGAGGAGGRGRGSNVLFSADAGSRGNNGQPGKHGEDGRPGMTTLGDSPVPEEL